MGKDSDFCVPEFDLEYAWKGSSCVEGKGWLYQVLNLQFLTSQKIYYKTIAMSLLQRT
jgi:hypothetical protein